MFRIYSEIPEASLRPSKIKLQRHSSASTSHSIHHHATLRRPFSFKSTSSLSLVYNAPFPLSPLSPRSPCLPPLHHHRLRALLATNLVLRAGKLLPDHVGPGTVDVSLPQYGLPFHHAEEQGSSRHAGADAEIEERDCGCILVRTFIFAYPRDL